MSKFITKLKHKFKNNVILNIKIPILILFMELSSYNANLYYKYIINFKKKNEKKMLQLQITPFLAR